MQRAFGVWFNEHYVFNGRQDDFALCGDMILLYREALSIGWNFASNYFQAKSAIQKDKHVLHKGGHSVFLSIIYCHAVSTNAKDTPVVETYTFADTPQPAIVSTPVFEVGASALAACTRSTTILTLLVCQILLTTVFFEPARRNSGRSLHFLESKGVCYRKPPRPSDCAPGWDGGHDDGV